ncbi:oligopeptide-binding protein OppA [Brevibacillus reuszeri]|uniref:ABC transporter substrate-binding protein n=1 Tax=Brevibacillus reuszeri TaxID=54915 RepID=A0A0K9YYG7_9BACL|nr:peptide ABC transporter substrate-binding protein [Brevibacillus reuszeri]KNB73275.1 ABC transporter substrate-binding protein [Brevibacillus reuszeri]MED1856888.1 peptide ABC transporter substrate-binding protein [Brevibacillus reuszeri]GED68362.1 oligopeptide-binding protein OppA [Brevibacillus reuszeri]
MKKTITMLVSSLLVAGSMLAACSSGSGSSSPASSSAPTSQPPASTPAAEPAKPEAQILRLNTEEPTTLDPTFAEDATSGSVISAIYDGLTRLDEKGEPINSIAENMKLSDDHLTYTFTLRDAKWTNGDPVTAHDFEFAWKHALDPKTGSPASYNYYSIKNAQAFTSGKAKEEDVGVKALDDKTLQVTMEHPTPFFPTLASFLPPVNKNVVQSNPKWANDPKTLVSNGPFKLDTWEHKNKLILVKNDTYWEKDVVKLARIEFSMISDTNTELSMFQNGDLDWAGGPISGLPVDAVMPLKQEGKLLTKPKATSYYIRFNAERPPFTNLKVRKAFAYAINRQEIADNIGQAGQTPLMGITPITASLKPEGFFADNQQEEAKKLLAEGMAELGITKLPSITYLYNTSDRNKAIAETLQATWKNVLGVDVKLLNKETKVYLDDQEQGKFEITRSSWTADYNDSINFLQKFVEKYSSSNITRWHSPKYTELINQSNKEADPAKRNQILLMAETLLMDEMPLTGIFSDVNAWVQNDKVKGVRIDPLSKIDFKWAYKE